MTQKCKQCGYIEKVHAKTADFTCSICLTTGYKKFTRTCAVCGEPTNDYTCKDCRGSFFDKASKYDENFVTY